MRRVMVVGAGVVGLTCAVRLLEAGYQVDVFARDLPLETTSALAAALWYPHYVAPQERITNWASLSYLRFRELADDPATGVRMIEGTELHTRPTPDPSWGAAVPGLTRVQPHVPGYVDGWTFTTPVVLMARYLRWLTERVAALGGSLTRMSLSELPRPAGVLVNASGLGALGLAADSQIDSVRGQVVVVEQVGLDRWWLDAAGPTYLVPRKYDIVIGGTEEPGEWSTVPDPHLDEVLLERAAALVPALGTRLRRSRVLVRKVGRRPVRPTVRVEAQRWGRTRVVHCYGHGGSGVTLSWGCADEVLLLIAGADE